MIPELAQRREELAELCRRFGVRRLEVFGSAATGAFDAESDFDFLVEFDRSDRYFDQFFGFKSRSRSCLDAPSIWSSIQPSRIPTSGLQWTRAKP